ncbi:MAG: protein kinase [Planctomycetes bacterium]|nr:protein kinase [Planctomycetota bacterium]MCC7172656.1 protein kinase [Planctomycetota bacterium]
MDADRITQRSRAPESVNDLVALVLERIESDGPRVIDELCAQHPQHAEALRRRVSHLRELGLLHAGPDQVPGKLPEQIGGHRLKKMLGGGGMGVVYLAQDEKLGREVALKMIRPELDYFPGARARFRREIETIARLQHPGIVPIYTVGEDGGVPYFTMERVRGCTLDRALDALRVPGTPCETGADLQRAIASKTDDHDASLEPGYVFCGSFEEAALRVVRQVAEALEHAHRRGVLHRDVKPSNIMVTPEGRAMLLDFGLAVGEENARLTRSGTRVGSLSYMPVEQAEGDMAAVTARSDVYSLGVSLYELLTRDVPYKGASQQATAQAIADGRPRAPRQRNPAVTWETETVCLTAMAVDANDRYASAADLARDLDNVLEGRPIEARRAGLVRIAVQWARRRPAQAAAVALGVALLVAVPTTLYLKERDAKDRIADEQRKTRLEADRAARHFHVALGAVNTQLRELAVRELRFVPQMEPVRRKLVEEALSLMKELGAETSTDPAVRLAMAETYAGVGVIQGELGDFVAADQSFAKQQELLRGLAAELPRDRDVARELAVATRSRFTLPRTRGDRTVGLSILDDALAQFEVLLSSPNAGPREHYEFAITLYNRAVAVLFRDPKAGEPFLKRALDEFERAGMSRGDPRDEQVVSASQRHAMALNAHAIICDDTGRWKESVDAYEAARVLLDPVAKAWPQRADVISELASILLNSTSAFLNDGRTDDAEAAAIQSIELLKPLVRDYPGTQQYRMDLANAYMSYGVVLERADRQSKIGDSYRAAKDLYLALAAEDPGNQDVLSGLAKAWGNLSNGLLDAGDEQGAIEAGEEAIVIMRQQLAADPESVDLENSLGGALHGVALARKNLGDRVGAKAMLLEAIAHQDAVLQRAPNYTFAIQFRCNHYVKLAEVQRLDGDYEAALDTARRMTDTAPKDPIQWRRLGAEYGAAAKLAAIDPKLTPQEREDRAQAYVKKALELLSTALDMGYSDRNYLETSETLDPLRDQPGFQALVERLPRKS